MKTVIWRACAFRATTRSIRRREETSGMDMERRDINRLIKAVESIALAIERNERDIKDMDIIYADGEPRMMYFGGKDYIITPATEEDGEI